MKTINNILLLLLTMTLLGGCSKDEVIVEQPLDVTYANIEGTWQLAEWNDAPVADDTYLYITFNRREKTYDIYQKFDSMYARHITGSYTIEQDEEYGAVISGRYDYGNGNWNNEYIVTNLMESGSMIWTVKDNDGDVSKYVRCNEVPDDIVNKSKSVI